MMSFIRDFLFGRPPDPPDYTPLAESQKEIGERQYRLGQEQLAFGKQRYQETLPLYQQMLSSNMEGQQLALDLAKDAAKERLKYRALEDSIVEDAQQFNRDQALDAFAGRAGSDVQQAISNQRQATNRNLQRFGINPNSARFAQINNELGLRGAAMEAGARTGARYAADAMGRGLTMNAANLGRNLPQNQLSAIGMSGNVNAATSGLLSAQNTPMYAGYSGASTGLQQQLGATGMQGNLLTQGYQNQLAGYQTQGQQMAALLNAAGTAYGFLADGTPGGTDQPELEGDGMGRVYGPGTETSDSIPAMLSKGEYVIPADVVRKKGVEFFDKLLEKYHVPASEQEFGIRRS